MEKVTYILEADVKVEDISKEDGEKYCGIQVNINPKEDSGLFIQICSWDELKFHLDFNKLVDRKIKITIETID